MNTKQAAIGRWAEIYKHYGLPRITGKTTLKGSVLCVVVRGNSAVTIKRYRVIHLRVWFRRWLGAADSKNRERI